MPIFIFRGYDVPKLEDFNVLSCVSEEEAKKLAAERCTWAHVCCWRKETKVFRMKRVGFVQQAWLQTDGDVITFVYEAGDGLKQRDRLESVLSQMSHKSAACIYDRGLLSAPHDAVVKDALQIAERVGFSVARKHSQQYGERGFSIIKHCQGFMYSPPSPLWVYSCQPAFEDSNSNKLWNGLPVSACACHIDRVVKIGLQTNLSAKDFEQPLAYHGVPVDPDSPLMNGKWKGGVTSGVKLLPHNGHWGTGLYVTPSFALAAAYAYRHWNGKARHRTRGPCGLSCLAVFMINVPIKAISSKHAGTAFSKQNLDGWPHEEIEWLIAKPESCTVYGVLFCYFNPDRLLNNSSLNAPLNGPSAPMREVQIRVCSRGFDDGNSCKFFIDGKQICINARRGFTIVQLDAQLWPERSGTFDTYGNADEARRLKAFVRDLPNGVLVLVGVKDSAAAYAQVDVHEALKQVGSSGSIPLGFRDGYALIGKKGMPPGSAREHHCKRQSGEAVVEDHITASSVSNVNVLCGAPVFRVVSAGFQDGNKVEFYKCAAMGNRVLAGRHLGKRICVGPVSRGFVIVRLDKAHVPTQTRIFDTHQDCDAGTRMKDFISGLQHDTIALIGIKDSAAAKLRENGYDALRLLGASGKIKLGYRDSYALIGRKGSQPGTAHELHARCCQGHVQLDADLSG